MKTNKESEQFLKEEQTAYRQSLKKEKIAQKRSLEKKRIAQKRFLEKKRIAQKQRLKEEKIARKQALEKKKQSLANKPGKKNYTLSNFDLRFKNSPKYQKEFREVEVKYSYRDQIVTYYLFVRKELNNEETLASAKNQIKHLIRTGEMRRYAKYYYRVMR